MWKLILTAVHPDTTRSSQRLARPTPESAPHSPATAQALFLSDLAPRSAPAHRCAMFTNAMLSRYHRVQHCCILLEHRVADTADICLWFVSQSANGSRSGRLGSLSEMSVLAEERR
jgi:hypothetical protein